MTDALGSGGSADTTEAERERLALWLGQMVAELAGQREDKLAELRAQAAHLAERFREAGEDRIARKLLLLTRPRASAGRRQEWLPLDHAILAIAVILLMWRDRLSVRGACRRLADRSIDRSWFLVFDSVVAARHRPTEHALYEQFRIWLRNHKSSISELNGLAKANGGVLPDADLPPHLLRAFLDAHAWFNWVNDRVPASKGPIRASFGNIRSGRPARAVGTREESPLLKPSQGARSSHPFAPTGRRGGSSCGRNKESRRLLCNGRPA